jgi:hypothetical protein
VQGFIAMGPIADGTYDVFVVRIELAITTGPSKGEVVSLRVNGIDRDALAMLGTPGTLTVVDGEPNMQFD